MKITEMTPYELRAWRIKEIVKRDGPLCFYPLCEINDRKFAADFADATFDHWNPRSAGGTWDIENLRIMHKRCNALKSDTIPLPDGTLPEKQKSIRAADLRAMRKAVKIEVCRKCNSGRSLGPEEFCDVCGSTAMPFSHPAWAKMKPQDCDHAGIWWCWACMSGIIERQPAIFDVLDAEGSLD